MTTAEEVAVVGETPAIVATATAPVPVVRVKGDPCGQYFKIEYFDVKQLGLVAHPRDPHVLRLRRDADPEAVLELPNGKRLTARQVTELSSKVGDFNRGWQIWVHDPGGFPPDGPAPEDL